MEFSKSWGTQTTPTHKSYPNYHLVPNHKTSSPEQLAHRSIIETGERFSESNPFVAGPQPSQSTMFAEHRFLRRPPSRSLSSLLFPFSPPSRPKLLPLWGAFNLWLARVCHELPATINRLRRSITITIPPSTIFSIAELAWGSSRNFQPSSNCRQVNPSTQTTPVRFCFLLKEMLFGLEEEVKIEGRGFALDRRSYKSLHF